ncbi:MAG: nucleotide kinase [Clostridia bacterium]|nr:nucleotide kinase [Clostridia bacterium]
MHVFLTGERQIGKSRVVRAAAEILGKPCAGFRTRFLTRERGSSSLYMVPAAGPEILDEAHTVAVLENGKMHALTERFDTLGTGLLREARRKRGVLILMDECGHLEKNAFLFQREIMACLDGPDPVLGVLRQGQPWHDFIKKHPRVTVITVTEDNRAELAENIAALIERP